MRHVVLASHHRFAQGLADTLAFLGSKSDFTVVCAYIDDAPLAPQVQRIFDGFDSGDEVLVLTDIMQGSVNQAFVPYVGPHTFIVAGVNVALAFELCLAPEPLTLDGIEAAVGQARNSMTLINTLQIEDGDDDE